MAIRAYLRASTKKQDAERAKIPLIEFLANHDLAVDEFYIENKSGILPLEQRPELKRLVNDSSKGDILIIESMDRLSRMKPTDYDVLDGQLKSKGLVLVIMSFSMSHDNLTPDDGLDDLAKALKRYSTELIIKVLATMAWEDYEKRRERQSQGIAKIMNDPKLKAIKYTGKQPDFEQYESILKLLQANNSYSQIEKILKVSPKTIVKAKKWESDGKPLPDMLHKRNGKLPQLDVLKERKRAKPVITAPVAHVVAPVEPKPTKAPKPPKRAKVAKNAPVEPVAIDDKTIDWVGHDWRVQGLTDGQIDKIKNNIYEFGDYNFELLPHITNYLEKFNHWQNDLKDPSKLGQFKGIDEILSK